MKKYIYRTVFFLCILGLAACDQEPLFWDIAHEYPPIDPIVGGAPSEIVPVILGGKEMLYVSNGELWEYDLNTRDAVGKPRWVKSADQPGKIKTIASISTANKKGGASTSAEFLYALCWDGTIWKWNGTSWTSLGGRGKPESGGYANIFGAGDYLFAGTKDTIYSIDPPTPNAIQIGTSLLSGAAFDGTNYFLATRGTGVYSTSSPGTPGITSVSGTDVTVLGLLYHDSTVPAKKGVYAVGGTTVWRSAGSTFSTVISGPHFTGGITSWTDGSNELLLLGLSRSSGTFGYGYREIDLGQSQKNIQAPGQYNPSSVVQGMEYISAIGDHAVNYLYVVPKLSSISPNMLYAADNEGRPIVFASTVKDGLWSYRMRRNTPQWNGEDNSD